MNWEVTKARSGLENSFDIFQREIGSLFNDFFSIQPGSLFENQWVPAIDASEESDKIRVKAEIPGLSEKDIDLQIENGILTISGNKQEVNHTEEKGSLRVSERKYGSFRRSIRLPQDINTDGITAVHKNGVLEIDIPKSGKSKATKVEIKSN